MASSPESEALGLGLHVVRLMKNLKGAPPPWIPLCKALLFYDARKIGFGIGLEHGHGFIISRLPFPAISPDSNAPWSPPCFLTVNTIEFGAIVGVEHVYAMVGLMTEQALEAVTLLKNGKVSVLGADCSICMEPDKPLHLHIKGERKAQESASSVEKVKEDVTNKPSHAEAYFSQDIYCCVVSQSGVMVDIGISGTMFQVDKAKNAQLYGAEVEAANILGGDVKPLETFAELNEEICSLSCMATVAAFDPSNASE